MSRNHEQLRVFHDAHEVAIAVYQQSQGFPRDEWFGLRSQVRRAAVSVACNIVEGNVRESGRDYVRFLHIALGSSCELDYLLSLIRALNMAPESDWEALQGRCQGVSRQLQRLIRSLSDSSRDSSRAGP
jgi:four helix bundle protein